ncbi:High-affinity branched-chain amino acid transport ATP-binding protein LivF [Roseovarius albus]|uniref:High-affinity branched-chain amino acid transport ATP-binding protein LivF n=1 Tax=Roseovarius albus TaxID=1247867 RepID=A0A1X6ZVG7_9RHOB|nr:ABC transporter ATP-binding protein [Roseovarius albus]SLN62996.1 High-affinity branched-chain amino acid transport ATP-binding protein LivF [Roseovarius albus]
MLELRGVNAGYDQAQVLRDLSLEVRAGEILCLLGRNGAGKTTTMKTIMGLLPLMSGEITLDGQVISNMPAYEIPRAGIGYVPQGRRLFTGLSVAQNLEVGLRARNSGADTLEEVLDLFPRLRERLQQPAQTLSGGEQQMLATARALCLRPKVLLLDEPTEGLQPSMIEAIRQVILKMRADGIAVLLIEQRLDAVLPVADRVAFIENGRNGETLSAETLRGDPSIAASYMGV